MFSVILLIQNLSQSKNFNLEEIATETPYILNRWKISVSLTLMACHSLSTCGLEIETKVETGIDTYLAPRHADGFSSDGEGCCANNVPQGEPLSGHNTMEVDTNQGGTGPVEPLIYFDLDFEPEPGMGSLLDRFNGTPGATATLQIFVSNGFDPLVLRRVIVDWISGPDGGNNISRITFPEASLDDTGSAFVDGVNVEPTANTVPDPAFVNQASGIITTDVTGDVAAWASGVSNYGWAGLPGASQGGLIHTFEEPDPSLRPKLIIQGPEGRRLKPLDGSTYVSLVTPRPNAAGISPNQPVFVEILNGDDPVNPESLALSIDGQEVEAVMNTIDGGVTLSWTPTGLSLAAAQINAEVSFSNQGTPNTLTTENWTYQVSDYATITSGLKVEDSLVNKSQPGFNISIHQMESGRPSGDNLPDPVRQVRSELIDDVTGAPFENLVDTFYPGEENKWVPNASFTDSQIFQEEDVINYEQGARDDPNAGEGNIQPDKPIPGIPGITISTDNIAFEATTILELEAGFHRMGVNSDDGFVLSSSLNPRDALAVQLGLFNGGRGDADTILDFLVEESGLYPFTLNWWQGGGGASVEWFSVDTATGDLTLINDTSNADAVKAYRSGPPVLPPYASSAIPSLGATGVSKGTNIEIVLEDSAQQVQTSSVKLSVNGQSVTAQVSKAGGTTTISYDPSAEFEPSSVVVVKLEYGDNASPPNVVTQEYAFKILPRLPAAGSLNVLVASGLDDAEEHLDDNSIDSGSSDLELGEEGAGDFQEIGIRFQAVRVPAGSTIDSATIQFTVDENDNEGATSLLIYGELSADPLEYGGDAGNISGRARTTAVVEWNDIPIWDAVGVSGPDQLTPDLSAIVQEIVEQPGWNANNAMAFIIVPNPGGERTAESFDGSAGTAPLLHIDYSGGGGGGDASISIARSAAGATITYSGTLQSADSVTGPYEDVAGASSPAEISFSGAAKFYRTRN